MKENYDVRSFFNYLGYPTGLQPYYRPGLRTLSVYCRGDRRNLEQLLEPTPFLLTDDRFIVQIADFNEASIGGFYDAGIVIPGRYGDVAGGNYLLEWEDKTWSIQFGREVWGYPKQYAAIALDAHADGAHGVVSRPDNLQFEIAMRADPSVDGSVWSDLNIYPHLQVHCLPEADGDGFKAFEIVARDTSKDTVPHSKILGAAEVTLGPDVQVNGVPLEVVQVLGGEYTVVDYACTPENGVAKVIDSLV